MTRTRPCSWGEIADGLSGEREDLEPLLQAMERFRGEEVLRVDVPYGAPIISEGRFHWSLADDLARLQEGYDQIPVPLGIVVSKSIELSTTIAFPGGNNGPVSRSVPAYLITRGEFFGLFENFALGLTQNPVNGFAGGTSLLVLPSLGRQDEIDAFAKSIGWTCPRGLRDNVKPTKSSSWDFGSFFAAVLEAVKCDWRLEIAIFPKPLLDKMRSDEAISLSLHGLTLRQLAVAHERVLSMMEMLTSRTKPFQEDVISIRQIERGNRPGFAPVLGTAADQEILPALELFAHVNAHGLFRERADRQGGAIGGGLPQRPAEPNGTHHGQATEYHPAIFRPSLPGEPFYYFLRRPLAFQPERDINIEQRARDVADDLRSADRRLRFALLRDHHEFEGALRQQTAGDIRADALPFHLGGSQFIEWGVIRVEPSSRTGTL